MTRTTILERLNTLKSKRKDILLYGYQSDMNWRNVLVEIDIEIEILTALNDIP